ncbi:MAG TPA: MFS transporter [Steroidobacteraceae bacterium]|nr:MFS transporter [Steroidobacteraceae bacterium]
MQRVGNPARRRLTKLENPATIADQLAPSTTMNKQEFRATVSLAAIFSLRLLGLFMIYPVFAAYARQLAGATPYKIGLALGIYGLSQGLLQIPFGMLSDRLGRKRMIVAGLLVFAFGSAVAAQASSIDGVIAGRVLQGAGAVGAVILALVADLTTEESRTKAMAMVGITIGVSFMIALVAGPILAGIIGVAGIFRLMVALALVAIGIVAFVVPAPRSLSVHRDAEPVPAMFGSVLRNPQLLRLDFGIFALHAMLTASFLVIPALLHARLHVDSRDQWMVYLPVLVASVAVMLPAIIIAEKHRRMKTVFLLAVGALAVSQLLLLAGGRNLYVLLGAITLFFAGFNVMEASLPSLVTKTSPAAAKGTATGVYSSAQFLGIFVGGIAGGWIQQFWGTTGVFLGSAAIAVLWLPVAATMQAPSYLRTRLIRIRDGGPIDSNALAGQFRGIAGVAEAAVVADERMAYLKVDPRTFDAAGAEALAG